MKRHRDFGMTQKSVWDAGLPEGVAPSDFLKVPKLSHISLRWSAI